MPLEVEHSTVDCHDRIDFSIIDTHPGTWYTSLITPPSKVLLPIRTRVMFHQSVYKQCPAVRESGPIPRTSQRALMLTRPFQ